MAKIIPSAIVSNIVGKLRGTVFQRWKGRNVMRSAPVVRSSGKASAANYRAIVSEISGCHYGLTALQQIAWNSYALLLPDDMTGFNAFIARNVALECANHVCLHFYANAPTVYDPPIFPSPIGVCFYPDSNSYCIFWATPSDPDIFVQGFFAPQAYYSNQYSAKWRLFGLVRSDALFIDFDASDYPPETMIRFTIRSINLLGELSARSDVNPPPPLPPSLSVLIPNGGETLRYGDVIDITWRSKNIDTISLYYSLNNGSDWNLIASSIDPTSGSRSWTVPSVSSDLGLIKIVSSEDPDISDVSNAVFSITPVPAVSITSPVGAESWPALSEQSITWTENDISTVSLYYSVNNGSDWILIESGVTAGDLSYLWTLPDTESDQALVKIVSDDDPGLSSVSPSVFSIISSGPVIDPIANWIFKTSGYDAGNTRFTDQTGNGHHLTNTNGVVDTDYTTLNGSNAQLSCADWLETGASGTKLSVAIWFKSSDTDGGLFGHAANLSSYQSWWISFLSSVVSFYVVKTAPLVVYKQYDTSVNVRDGNLHLIGFTFDNGVFKVYVDGVEDTAVTKTKDDVMADIRDSSATFNLGYLNTYAISYGYLTSIIYKAWIYDDVLSASDFLSLYNLGE